jgi:alpha-aminoadipate carrier protein LysW
MAVVCPECDNPLDVDTDIAEEGEVITCDECGTDIEIVSVDPLELAPVDSEVYDDEDEDDDVALDDDDDDDE